MHMFISPHKTTHPMKTKMFIAICLVCLTGMAFASYTQAQTAVFQLITNDITADKESTEVPWFILEKEAVVRIRPVTLHSHVKSAQTVQVGDMIEVNLFKDAGYWARVEWVESISDDNVTLTAKLDEFNYAYLYVSTTGNRTLAVIDIPEKRALYRIKSDMHANEHYLMEYDGFRMQPEISHPPVEDDEELSEEEVEEQERIKKELEKSGKGLNDPATIDVMYVYTPAAKAWADTSGGGMINRMGISLAISQNVMTNSRTGVTFNLVHHRMVDYTESSLETDLKRLKKRTDRHIDIIHRWRDEYGADLVQLFTMYGSEEKFSGYGQLLQWRSGRTQSAFSVVKIAAATGYTPIHEWGHNLGCHHHKDQTEYKGPTKWHDWYDNNWSAGWRWQGNDSTYYCSIMTYASSEYWPDSIGNNRVPYFSDPGEIYQGQAIGHYTYANNAHTIRAIKHVIAAYRSPKNIACPELPSYNFDITPQLAWNTHASTLSTLVSSGCRIYRVDVDAGNTYHFKTGCGDGADANFQVELELYDAEYNPTEPNYHPCEPGKPNISWFATYSGKAYLIVKKTGFTPGANYVMAYKKTAGGNIVWTGKVSNNWFDPENWNLRVIPNAAFDVIIPKKPSAAHYSPWISGSSARCKSLTIQRDALVNIYDSHLVIHGHLDIHGQLRALSRFAGLTVYDDVNWHELSSAEVNFEMPIRVFGNWRFYAGSNVQLNKGTVMFMGRNSSFIQNHSAHSSFHALGSYKTHGAYVGISARSTHPLRIDGALYVHPEAGMHIYTGHDIRVSGNISSAGTFLCTDGKVILTGNVQEIRMHEGNYYNNLTFNQSGMAYINQTSAALHVRGHVEIRSGLFHMQDGTLHVGGNWNNHAGDDAFNPGTGRVVFNGSDNQHIYTDARFNILETNLGGNLMIGQRLSGGKGPLVTCQRYHWTAGGVEVLNGTFTARDLSHMAIFGRYKVHPSGTINLHQGTTPLESVDLNCTMEFVNGGNINVYGGAGTSRWPFVEASIIMNGGVLDFKDQGINIRHTGTLHTNITGGVIRTSKGFTCTRSNFAPAGGTIELYGSSHANLSVTAGSLPSLSINKTSKSSLSQASSVNDNLYHKDAVYPQEETVYPQEEPTWRVVVDDDLDIIYHLFITGGDFIVGDNRINVTGNLDIYGNVVMNHADGELQVFGNVRWFEGSTADFSANALFRVHGNWSFLDGSQARLANGIVQFWGETNSYINSNSATSHFFNIGSYKREGAASIVSSTSVQSLTINNDIYVHPGAIFLIQSPRDVIVNREINSNGSFRCTNGRVVLNGTDQYLKMNVGDYFNDLSFSQSGRTIIDARFSNILKVNRHLIISSGVFQLFDKTIQVGGNWINTAGASAFVAGAGRVVFNGGGFQHIYSSENFHILEVNKTGYLRINNPEHAVVCQQYDWRMGGIEVVAGSFTANDLIQNGLFGSFKVHRDGVMNITNQAPGTFVDLVGELQNLGGTINLTGTEAWWPATNGARLMMTGGVIDFKTCGLYIPSGYTWTNDITGGTIRTPFGFSGNDGNFAPSGGTMEFYGPGNAFVTQTAGKLHHIKIDKAAKSDASKMHTGPVTDSRSGLKLGSEETAGEVILMSDLRIAGNLDLKTGSLNASEKTIYIGGNWTNHLWPIGFNAYGSRVVFNGTGNQTCSSETFHTLELNKSGGVLFIPQETDCVLYDWTSGGINVNGGTFTAHDLAQINIQGNYSVNSGGTINLHQNASRWVDLNGSIYINSGTMNVYGGEAGSDSWWPDEAATLFMTGGVLDFKDQGIFIRNTRTFASLITGGTIRTSKGYRGERADFNPTAGTFEFYGPEDAAISQANGSSLHHVVIDKSGGDGSKSEGYTKRDGTKSSTAMTNKVIAMSNLVFTNGLRVDSGNFLLNGHQLSVDGNVHVNTGGTLVVDANASLLIGANKRLQINENGYLAVVGSKGAEARISRISSGNYQFDIERGGTLAASHALFEHMNTNGILVKPGALIDPQHPFTNCTFQKGASGGQLITFHNSQVFTISGAHFPENSWGGSHNAYKGEQSGHVTFEGYTGPFSGHLFEYDPYNRIDWGEAGLAAEPLSRHVPSKGGMTTYEIITDMAWSASSKQTWLTLAPIAGKGSGVLEVTYTSNEGKEPRTATIILSFTGAPDITLTLTQDGTIAHYGSMDTDQNAVSETHTFEPNETEQLIHITNSGQGNVDYVIDVEFDDPDKATAFRWLLVDPVAGTIKPGQSIPITITFNSEGLQHADKSPAFGIYRARLLIFGNNPHKPQPEKVVKVTFSFDELPDTPFLLAHPQEVVVGPESGTTSFEIYSNLQNLTMSENIPWVLISRLTGNSLLTVTYGENLTVFPRSGEIILSAESVPDFVITINQEGSTPYLSVSHASIEMEAAGGTQSFELSSNASWDVINMVPWITVLPADGTGNASLTLTIEENTEVSARHGIITIVSDHAPANSIAIYQQGADVMLSVTPGLQFVSASEGLAYLDVASNIDWRITETSDWLNIFPLAGTGSEPVKITYGYNPSTNQRRGLVTVDDGEGNYKTAIIIQEGLEPILIIEPPIYDVLASAGTVTFALQSNTAWTVTEEVPWLSVNKASGSNSTTLVVAYDANLLTEARKGEITITAQNLPEQVIAVRQAGLTPILHIEPLIRETGAEATTVTFFVQSNTDWIITEEVPWLNIFPMAGYGVGTVTVTVEENLSITPRTGELFIQIDKADTLSATISQQGAAPYLFVEPNGLFANWPGASYRAHIRSNTRWEITSSEDWLTIEPMDGFGSAQMTIDTETNNTGSPRTGLIQISSEGLPEAIIEIYQDHERIFLGKLEVDKQAMNELHQDNPTVTEQTIILSNTGTGDLAFDIMVYFNKDTTEKQPDGYSSDQSTPHTKSPDPQNEENWLYVNTWAGLIEAGGYIPITVIFDSEKLIRDDKELPFGTYYATLEISDNNEESEDDGLIVDVILHFEADATSAGKDLHDALYYSRVYPTITRNYFTLELSSTVQGSEAIVYLIGSTGEMIRQYNNKTTGTYQMDISDRLPGVYFVRVIMNDRVEVWRVIKQ